MAPRFTRVNLMTSCFLFCTVVLSGQCDPPELIPTDCCTTAPVVCMQDACYSTDNLIGCSGAHSSWCGPNTAIHNPQYFEMIVTELPVNIQIHVDNCSGGGCGLQSAILNACPWNNSNVLVCNAGMPAGGTMVLITSNAMVGDTLYLVIDGCAGQLCQYTITHASGIYEPQLEDELTSAGTDHPVVCPGWQDWTAFANPPISGAAGYLWTGFPWGDHTTTFNDMSGPNDPLTIPTDAPAGTYQICVTAFTGCDVTSDPQCFDLTIEPILPGQSPTVTACPEVYTSGGIPWHAMNITSPGTYSQSFTTPEGCPYDSTKQFNAFPSPPQGVVNHVECGQQYQYEGVTYNVGGTYVINYPNANTPITNQYGCDSSAVLNLDLIYLEVDANFYCDFTVFNLTSQLVVAIPNAQGIMYTWYDQFNQIVCQTANCQVYDPGVYTLFVSNQIDGVTCTYAAYIPVVIDLEDLVPDPPALNAYSPTACQLDDAIYSVEQENGIIFYQWTTTAGLIMTNDMAHQIQINWQGTTGGTVCVEQYNHCGPSPPTCFDVTVIPSPIAEFDIEAQTCVDSAVWITFTGSASMDAQFNWNFGAGAEILSGGTGPGPHLISWPAPGTKVVTLQIVEEGCDDESVAYNIIVSQFGTPVVNCSSTTNSVTFSWSPVSGAYGYGVDVLNGPGGVMVNDTTYEIAGLSPGDTVAVEVFAFTTSACMQSSVTIECIAQSCPSIDIQITAPATELCLGDVSGTVSFTAVVEGMTGLGTWSGPGMSANGEFDAHTAGPGVHNLIFSYVDGTCPHQRGASIQVFDTPTADFTASGTICVMADAQVMYTGSASPNATYQWNFGPGSTVVSGSDAGPYVVEWGSAGMQTISLTVIEDGCVSDVFTQTVTVQPALSAPAVSCAPTTSSVTFQWAAVANASGYNVNVLTGPAGTLNGTQYVVDGLIPGDTVEIQLVVNSANMCPGVTTTVTCVARECPSPVITITAVDDICLYPGTGTVALQIAIQNGNGSGFWAGPGIIDPNAGIFNPNVSGPGTHLIEFHYSDDGCDFLETIDINVYGVPSAVISNTDLILTCENNNELVLDGSSSSPGVMYQWSTSDGVLLSPANAGVVTAGAQGTYQLLVFDPVSGCRDSVSVFLDQDDDVPVADAGPDGTLDCNIRFIQIGGPSTSTGSGIEYQWSTDSGVIMSDPNQPTINVGSPGVYQLEVMDMNNGCRSEDTATVSENVEHPLATLNVSDILTCETTTATVTATIMPGGGNYSYQWQTSNGVIQSGQGSSQIMASAAGMYVLYVTNQINGCRDTAIVEVFADDTVINEVEAMVQNPLCPGDQNGEIEVLLVLGGTPPFNYQWSNGSTSSSLANLLPGAYALTVTDANGCEHTSSFTLPVPIPLVADIGPNLRLKLNELAEISLVVNDPGSVAEIIWGGIAPDCPGCFQNQFSAELTGTVLVTVIDTNGCIATTSLELTVFRQRNIFVPAVFTPNGDQINDYLTVMGNTITTVNSFRIFDRWGDLVFEKFDFTPNIPTEGWDGTFNGRALNPGVFVYMAEILHEDGLIEVIKGDVTLLR